MTWASASALAAVPVGHQEYRDLALEHLADPPLDARVSVVVAVAEREALVGARQRLQDSGRDAGGVVACEIHRKRPERFGRQR